MEELDEPPDESHRIGNTILARSKNLESLLKCERLYLKFEGSNPTGTQKDRASYESLKLAREHGYDSLAIATCGNFGASFAYFAPKFGIKAHIYIPADYKTERIYEMASTGSVIHRIQGTYEDAVYLSGIEAKDLGWFNANPGEELNTEASIRGYAKIAYEIYESLGYVPDVVSAPIGNGTTFAGVFHGFKTLYDEGETDKIPRMIGASTPLGNPVVKSFLEGLRMVRDLSPTEIKETSLNEPLVSWHSFDGDLALDAIWESEGWATYVSDQEMVEYARLIAREEGILTLPASASALAAIAKYAHLNKSGASTYVAILTARKPEAVRRRK
ncbi:MAG: pyridoxal-phosphate dependent enzyme [Candidatus Bathyarchaeia archaeon]